MFRKTVQHLRFPVDMAEARNGRDCLDLLTNGEFGLAFIDVFMPEMSGLEALGNARFMGNKIFVTLMSAYPNERCLKLARELQAYEFLFKPFGPSEIGAILETYRRACQPMRALIADDSPTQRRIVSRVLSPQHVPHRHRGDGRRQGGARALRCLRLRPRIPRL
jgi:CheY-like chemotaxis protein